MLARGLGLGLGRQRGLVALRNVAKQGERPSSVGQARNCSGIQKHQSLVPFPTSAKVNVYESFQKLQCRKYHDGLSSTPRMRIRFPEGKRIIHNSRAESSSSPEQVAGLGRMDRVGGAGTRSTGRTPRRKALFAPPSFENQYQVWGNDEDEEEARKNPDDLEADAMAMTDSTDLEPQTTISVVEAYYAAKTIDLAPLITSNLTTDATRKKFNRDNLLLELSSNSANTVSTPSYVAVYRFGSVIFFNVSPRAQVQMLQSIKRYATEPLAPGFEQKDTFGVAVMPNALKTRVTSEHCIVPQLNMNAVAVISEVMAQSVALESYNEIVDSLLDKFAVLNSKVATSSKMDVDKNMLFSKIAQNNRIFIDLISKLRIKGRSQIAWDQGEYAVIHSGMTAEFDIDDRFELIEFKLDLIQQNSKLFLEVIQYQKSASLEWIIVVLIGFECVLMCLEMSGQGAVMFENIKSLFP